MQLRPSSAHMWMRCAAQPRMASMMPPELPGDPAREGTCAAWVAEMVLTGAVSSTNDMIGRSHENGWLVEPDMAYHIGKYVDLVRSNGGDIHTERRVKLNDVIEGTPDAFAVMTSSHTLCVDDLKYGYGLVEPYRNPQVSIYAGAIVRMLTARNVRIDVVHLGIYQPRAWHPAGPHRRWSVRPETLMAFVHEIEAAGRRAQDPEAVTTPGDHCRYCPAAATCVGIANANYENYERIARDDQRHMRAEELSVELAFLERAEAMLKGRKDAIHAEAAARMTKGEYVPDYHLERAAGQRRFTKSRDVIRAMTGIDPRSEKLVTPAELERMGASPSIVARLVETPRTKPQLKRVPPGYYANVFPKVRSDIP